MVDKGLPNWETVSGSILVPKGSASGQGLETPPTVSDHAVPRIVVANSGHLAHVYGYRYIIAIVV